MKDSHHISSSRSSSSIDSGGSESGIEFIDNNYQWELVRESRHFGIAASYYRFTLALHDRNLRLTVIPDGRNDDVDLYVSFGTQRRQHAQQHHSQHNQNHHYFDFDKQKINQEEGQQQHSIYHEEGKEEVVEKEEKKKKASYHEHDHHSGEDGDGRDEDDWFDELLPTISDYNVASASCGIETIIVAAKAPRPIYAAIWVPWPFNASYTLRIERSSSAAIITDKTFPAGPSSSTRSSGILQGSYVAAFTTKDLSGSHVHSGSESSFSSGDAAVDGILEVMLEVIAFLLEAIFS